MGERIAWEYQSVYGGYLGLDMDALGREGWELVAVCRWDENAHCPTLFFKRPLALSDKQRGEERG